MTASSATTILHPARRTGWSFVKPSVIPGFGLTFGYTLFYLSIIVLIPLLALALKAATVPLDDASTIVLTPASFAASHSSRVPST